LFLFVVSFLEAISQLFRRRFIHPVVMLSRIDK